MRFTYDELKSLCFAVKRAERDAVLLDMLKKREMSEETRIVCKRLEAGITEAFRNAELALQDIAQIEDGRVRQIAMLRFVEGMSWKEIAAAIGGGASESCARMALKRYFE